MNPLIQLTAFLVVATLSSSSIVKSPPAASSGDNFELLILHNNDMHARFEQTSQLSGTCTPADRDAGKCYGGFPRVAYVVKEARRKALNGEGPPVLYLNAGDTYTGTAWFTIYKWKIAAEFINALQPDAVSLDNDEIKSGSSDISPFLNSINTKIVSSNVMFSTLEDNEKIQKSIILDIDGRKVGIVGYLKLNTKFLDSTGQIEYVDEILALKEEVAKLKALKIDIIVALGHSNIDTDIEIAKEIEDIDIVIGGRKNIIHWNGDIVQSDTKEPFVVTQKSGKQVLVVQSSAYDKYLGSLNIKFDSNGNIIEYNSKPILLDESVFQDPESLRLVNKYYDEITSTSQEVLGQTSVVLDGDSCKREECNFGNLITDSMMYYYAVRFEGSSWTDAPIAIINGNAISSSISPPNRPASITTGDLLSALSIEDNLVTITITGTIFNELLEYAVADYSVSNPSHFLQFSGVRVVYDLEKDVGSRVISAVVRCSTCSVPQFYVIEESKEYKIIVPTSLLDTQYGFSSFQGLPTDNLKYDIVTCVTEYINQRTPIYPEVAGRISLGNHEFDNGVSGLKPFIKNVTCPVLASNLDLTMVPELANASNLMNSVIIDIKGTKVGIIGYLTPDTKVLAIKNYVKYIEEVTAIKKEVATLKKLGVEILIALGHSGFTKDLEIANKVEDIDVVIGGHTNTFLWNGTVPDIEKSEGPYPTLVKQHSGRLVPVIQAYAYTKYIGKLYLVFNSEGELVKFNGNPTLLDKNIPQDPDVLAIVNKYHDDVLKVTEDVVGSTLVHLDGHSCRLHECNMGNLITDAMIYKYASEYKGEGWTDAPIAIIQGGGIRSSITHSNTSTKVTRGDLLTVMPFDGMMVKVTVKGTEILKMLEHAVAKYRTIRALGQFLQLSGIRVEYDFNKSPGQRVVKVLIRCGICQVPIYLPLNTSSTYNILMPSFLAMGGDGLSSLGNHEFDNGVSGLTPFIENLTSPVLAANLILTKVPELANETNLKKSIILDVFGQKIGIVGYLTPDTKILAVKNDVEYIDEVVALKVEVANLQKQGIKIIIGLGHSGFAKDLEIAKEVDGLDLVIGGHSNTFLWNGTTPDTEEPQGPYPTYVRQSSGRLVPVVQAYAYTKYLGKLHMVFDANGELVSADGYPILLDNSIPQDPEIVNIVERYREGVTSLSKQVVGSTAVLLDGLSCQDRECNMGNLITDAMIFTNAENYTGQYWTDAAIAIIQGGGVRSSIAHPVSPAAVTEEDLINVLPFQGSLVRVTLNGNTIIQMLEHASLGNHEFDEGVDGVVPFIRNLTSPVLAANLILDKVPELEHETNLYKTIVLTIAGNRIGIIGYLTPETKFLAPRNKVEYEDEVIAITREVNKLKEQGINIIIALGHSGFYKDLEIAKNVPDLDVVIGGHSNTFLYNGRSEEKPEIPQGPYPTIVKQSTGKPVLVVQAYAYTKYIGQLYLTFNADGEIVNHDGTPLLLNEEVPNDPELLQTINKYRSNIDRLNSEIIGVSSVFLNGDCRLKECNIGDLITDAILNYTRRYYKEYSDAHISVVQGGRIRASIDRPDKPFNLTRNDWMTVLPFSDPLTIVTMNGTILKKMLEHSVSTWRLIDSTGQFLQVSGMQVVYDLAKPPGSRVISVRASCTKCKDMEFRDVQDYYEYRLFMPSFLADAGDGYTIFDGLPKEQIQYTELECVLDYIRHYGPISLEGTGRLTINNEDKVSNETFNKLTGSNSVLLSPNINIYFIIISMYSVLLEIL
ncbi:uncharacterized protein LOC113516144 [Galleria mellonella]|uniref:5'-nucleotidase n=1 Tax=Galleria mellonella TaxID=7137 RepID=A0A6J1WMV0_GALME|nr:uncharacterized protein LOC113516144 [Galleria mellonella]